MTSRHFRVCEIVIVDNLQQPPLFSTFGVLHFANKRTHNLNTEFPLTSDFPVKENHAPFEQQTKLSVQPDDCVSVKPPVAFLQDVEQENRLVGWSRAFPCRVKSDARGAGYRGNVSGRAPPGDPLGWDFQELGLF